MRSKNTYLRVLFLVCLVTGPAVMACEAALDFDRNKIQHYASSDGAPPAAAEDAGNEEPDDPDTGTNPPDTGAPDTGPRDAGRDADADTGA